MNFRFSTATAAFGCILLASCYPYDESRDRRPPPNKQDKTITSREQQDIQKQRDELKKKEEEAKKEAQKQEETKPTQPDNTTDRTPEPEPQKPEKKDYPFANKVPGKEGFVFSPYNNKVVDVRDIPSGTLVQDPTYTGGKGYFRVP